MQPFLGESLFWGSGAYRRAVGARGAPYGESTRRFRDEPLS